MKVLLINDCDHYYFPKALPTLSAFVHYLNAHPHELIPLMQLCTWNCVHPYYIEEDRKLYYVNAASVSTVTDDEVFIMPRDEYDTCLDEVVDSLCVGCANYEEGMEHDNLSGHREKLCLDGTCWGYVPKDEE